MTSRRTMVMLVLLDVSGGKKELIEGEEGCGVFSQSRIPCSLVGKVCNLFKLLGEKGG